MTAVPTFEPAAAAPKLPIAPKAAPEPTAANPPAETSPQFWITWVLPRFY